MPEYELVFDTETTGLVNFDLPADHPSQPVPVQVAALLVRDGVIVSSMNVLVNTGVEIPAAATRVHGITQEEVSRCGLAPGLVVNLFMHMQRTATRYIGHNIRFDIMVMASLMRPQLYVGGDANSFIRNFAGSSFCTMQATTPLLNLPGKYRKGPKWPRLEEAYQHFFGVPIEGAHDAMNDAMATFELYLHLKAKGLVG